MGPLAILDAERHFTVWAARGGHGATTVAGALARFWRTAVRGGEQWEHQWMFGPTNSDHRRSSRTVNDAGVLRSAPPADNRNIVVLRGPSTTGLRTLAPLVGVVDHLVVIREPWRRVTNSEIEDVLDMPVAVEIGFSERVSRLADAGLLGVRLDKLEEFDQLRKWAARQNCEARLSHRRREQVARHT